VQKPALEEMLMKMAEKVNVKMARAGPRKSKILCELMQTFFALSEYAYAGRAVTMKSDLTKDETEEI